MTGSDYVAVASLAVSLGSAGISVAAHILARRVQNIGQSAAFDDAVEKIQEIMAVNASASMIEINDEKGGVNRATAGAGAVADESRRRLSVAVFRVHRWVSRRHAQPDWDQCLTIARAFTVLAHSENADWYWEEAFLKVGSGPERIELIYEYATYCYLYRQHAKFHAGRSYIEEGRSRLRWAQEECMRQAYSSNEINAYARLVWILLQESGGELSIGEDARAAKAFVGAMVAVSHVGVQVSRREISSVIPEFVHTKIPARKLADFASHVRGSIKEEYLLLYFERVLKNESVNPVPYHPVDESKIPRIGRGCPE